MRLGSLWFAKIIAMTMAAYGCGGGGVSVADRGAPDTPVADPGTHEDPGVSGEVETTTPDFVDVRVDTPEDPGPVGEIPVEDIPPSCPGNLNCPCKDNSDCFSGFCIETMENYFCTNLCTTSDSCPSGWSCAVVATQPDTTYACVPASVNLCRPCVQDAECASPYVSGKNLCIDRGPEGSFCGLDCSSSGCPDGFVCQAQPGGRGDVKQCVPEEGQSCPCTQKFKDKAYKTGCFQENEFGKCLGTRSCDSACSAPIPAAETCNNKDDDCDGQTDDDVAETACDLTNDYGTCKGKTLCVGGKEICQGSYAAPEVCNGKDDNCDGQTDEGFPDADNDGIADCVDQDTDGDGIIDVNDNCKMVPNADQANNEGDDEGDACDPDDDNDGIADVVDNCPMRENPTQEDRDKDVIGDVCDPDLDGDNVPNETDNCPSTANPDQEDVDGDKTGDACDSDIDDDGLVNMLDNCPNVANPDQADNDKDLVGDACDPDDDNDTVPDETDNCPMTANPDQMDNDADGTGDLCDPDIDGDGLMNAEDNCPNTNNPKQEDLNQNGIGDACESDWDGDGIPNDDDNCTWTPNDKQEDMDGDGVGDACDCDIDGDDVFNENPTCQPPDVKDNCPTVANPWQDDMDGDFIGDACDPDIDGDKDLNETDCEPMNPEVFHNQIEKCNEIDDNCNFIVDEQDAIGCEVFHYDGDKDGYGTDTLKCLCAPSGFYSATNKGDCDDTDATVTPAAVESCNGKDDDCDGLTDEQDATGCMVYYRDIDGDGYGLTDDKKCLCIAVTPYTTTKNEDCNDTDNSVYPGATEKCNQKDDDCDSETDEADSIGCSTYYLDEDRDGYGLGTKPKCLCFAVAPYDAGKAGDCDDTNKNVSPSGQERCNELDDNCNGLVDEDDAIECVNYYMDQDRDTFGIAVQSQCKCKPKAPYDTTVVGDCNDNDKSIYPGASEACNLKDDNCDGQTDEQNAVGCLTFYFDSDGDGFGLPGNTQCLCAAAGKYTASQGGDCNDNDKTIYPGAVETCNQKDDDCDGQMDEENAGGCKTFWLDEDVDSFGLTSKTRCLCAPEGNYSAVQSGDCDDKDQTVYPGAIEVCNVKDDNCNGQTDEENAVKCMTFYFDGDGDMWGSTANKCLCAASGPYTTKRSGDCNDNMANINPDAQEVCNGVDDNCNGATDEENAATCTTHYFDSDSDGFGVTSNTKCLCKPDGKYSATVGGDCNDLDKTVFPGATEVCNNKDDNCVNGIDEEGASGCKTYYFDNDNDGFGVTGKTKCLCVGADKYTADKGGDCNDNASTQYPGATEVCGNSADDNCNGKTDEAGCQGCITYFKDTDGDGYGVTGDSQCLSGPTGQYTATKDKDCNDAVKAINPGTTEVCNNLDDNCNNQTDEENASNCQKYYYDSDQDNFGVNDTYKCLCAASGAYRTTAGGDCNDSDKTVYPGAPESCNGKDDDCDSLTDEEGATNCTVNYWDNDSDTYGIASKSKCLCAKFDKYTATKSGDCVDDNPNINPGAAEKCNAGVDDNCDGITDPENAPGCTVYFYDYDNDKWGTSSQKCLCAASGYYRATNTGDCNDNSTAIYPGAKETCNSLDDDCDGATDEEGATNCTTYYYDGDGDGYGVSSNSKCLCAKTGSYTALNGGDCNDTKNTVYPTAKELCNKVDDDCDAQTDEDTAAAMCGSPAHATPVCSAGVCSLQCDSTWFDINTTFTDGCECQQDGNDTTGNSCDKAISLTSLSDSGSGAKITQSGRIVPNNDVDWYTFKAIDTPDTGGTLDKPKYDNFYVRALLTKPTDGSLRVVLYEGSCSAAQVECAGGASGGTDADWYTDYRDTTNFKGEAPCFDEPSVSAPAWKCCKSGQCEDGGTATTCCGGKKNDGTNCTDDLKNKRYCTTKDRTFYVKVFRPSGAAATCAATEYTLEISNGVYSH